MSTKKERKSRSEHRCHYEPYQSCPFVRVLSIDKTAFFL